MEGSYGDIAPHIPELEAYSRTSIDTNSDQSFLIRTIELENTKTHEKRLIKHIQTPDWKDGSAFAPEQMLHLKNMIDSFRGEGQVLIHCSAGVGRTGQALSFFVLDDQLKDTLQEKSDPTVNVFKTVYDLRLLRPGLVLFEPQYNGVYDALQQRLITG